jgi:hypothetical protein
MTLSGPHEASLDVTTDQLLLGVGLIVVIAVGSQVLPSELLSCSGQSWWCRDRPLYCPCSNLLNESDHTIVATFGAEYRGLVQYYLLAGDVYKLNRLEWVMRTSMLRTLASRHRSSVPKMAARHRAKIATPHGPRTCF